MECPKCKTFNFPGSTRCSQCGYVFQEEKPPVGETFYPPRKSGRARRRMGEVRDAVHRLKTSIAGAIQSASMRTRRTADSRNAGIAILLAISALIPGGGYWFIDKKKVFVRTFGLFVVLVILAGFTIKQFISNVFLLAALIIWYSAFISILLALVWKDAPGLQRIKQKIGGIILATALLVELGAMMSFTVFHNVSIQRMAFDLYPPYLQARDTIYVRKIGNRAKERLHHGQWVSVRTTRGVTISPIIGLPGDRVAMKNGKLYINGVLVTKERLDIPIIRGNFSFLVQEGMVLIWITRYTGAIRGFFSLSAPPPNIIQPEGRTYRAQPSRASMKNITGVIRAIVFPAHRRRWFPVPDDTIFKKNALPKPGGRIR